MGSIGWYVYLLLLYVLGKYKFLSGWALTCDTEHSLNLSSTSPLGDQAAISIISYPTYSDNADTDLNQSLPYHTKAMHLAREVKLWLTHWFDSSRVCTEAIRIHPSFKMGDGCSTRPTIPSGLSSLGILLGTWQWTSASISWYSLKTSMLYAEG